MKYLLAAALLLAGCATSAASEGWTATTNAQRITWTNNTSAWLVTCNRTDLAGCYSRATALCPSGYDRLDETPAGMNSTITVACS